MTDDDRIAITGGNQCIDFGPSGAQTYQCTTGNANQVCIHSEAHRVPEVELTLVDLGRRRRPNTSNIVFSSA